MSLRLYLVLMGFGTVLAIFGWVVVIWTTDPNVDGIISLVLFYLTLFLSVAGFMSILGLLTRVYLLRREELLQRLVRISFRHAVFIGLVSCLTLILSAQNLLRWWLLGFFFILVCAVESIFLLKENGRRT